MHMQFHLSPMSARFSVSGDRTPDALDEIKNSIAFSSSVLLVSPTT